MASPAIMVRKSPADLWQEFQGEAERQVRECNSEAGEVLWSVGHSGESRHRLTIASTVRSANWVECAFDPRRGVLMCSAGSVGGRPLYFRRGEWTPGAALALVLGMLAEADGE